MIEKHKPVPVAWARMKDGEVAYAFADRELAEFVAGFAANELVPLYLRPQPAPDVQGEPVAYLRKDQLRKAQRMGAALGEIANSPRVDRVPVYDAPQPAEQQPAPDVEGLVEALTMARETIASALRANAPEYFTTDADIARHVVIQRIDTALAHRKGDE